jgi:TonB family protein
MTETNGFTHPCGASRRHERLTRRTMILSLALHAGVILLSPGFAFLHPSSPLPRAIVVDLTDPPPSELPKEEPVPPAAPVSPKAVDPAAVVPAAERTPANPPPAHRWLAKLDAGLSRIPDAPVRSGAGSAGDLPVRRWTADEPSRNEDFVPAAAPEDTALLGHIRDLEERVRSSRESAATVREEEDVVALMTLGGTGDSPAEPIPDWIREMIRGKVRGYLPELRSAYSAALHRNPLLAGRLVVRFRIDPSGRITRADPVETSVPDDRFTASVMDLIRQWRFDPTPLSVEVLYPFVFVAPS